MAKYICMKIRLNDGNTDAALAIIQPGAPLES